MLLVPYMWASMTFLPCLFKIWARLWTPTLVVRISCSNRRISWETFCLPALSMLVYKICWLNSDKQHWEGNGKHGKGKNSRVPTNFVWDCSFSEQEDLNWNVACLSLLLTLFLISVPDSPMHSSIEGVWCTCIACDIYTFMMIYVVRFVLHGIRKVKFSAKYLALFVVFFFLFTQDKYETSHWKNKKPWMGKIILCSGSMSWYLYTSRSPLRVQGNPSTARLIGGARILIGGL